VGQAFAQVEAHITDEDINLADVPALITVLKTAFGNPDCMVIAEQKLEAVKLTKCHFSTYYIEFQCNAADVQYYNSVKYTALMRGLNNEIKDVPVQSDNVLLQFQEFIAFL
jgi:hypothetical protein